MWKTFSALFHFIELIHFIDNLMQVYNVSCWSSVPTFSSFSHTLQLFLPYQSLSKVHLAFCFVTHIVWPELLIWQLDSDYQLESGGFTNTYTIENFETL